MLTSLRSWRCHARFSLESKMSKMSKFIMYHQNLANTNGIANPDVPALPLFSCLDADIVLLSILGNWWTYGWFLSASKMSKFTMYFQYSTNINGAFIAKVHAWILECYFKADVVLFWMHLYSLSLNTLRLVACQWISPFPSAECSYAMSLYSLSL